MAETDPSVTQDRILDGAVLLNQPAKGYRAGIDAALLAAACDAKAGERVLEIGCGVGGALLAAAHRRPDADFTGLELDPATLALAEANIAANGMGGRVRVQAEDITGAFARSGLAPFDAAFANPPFFDDPAELRAPHPAKTAAWMAEGGLSTWTDYLTAAVKPKGTITLIHRADRLADILARLEKRCGSFRIRPIQPFADTPAKRILVRCIMGGRAPLVLLPALVLHEAGTKYSKAAEAILRGQADLPWE